jgi:hypothetical protein
VYIDELTDKSVSYSPTLTARASEIRPLTESDNGSLGQVIRDLKSLHERAENWCPLSSTERVLLEEKWTKILLMLLKIGNLQVMRSVRYRLEEETADEDEQDVGMGN